MEKENTNQITDKNVTVDEDDNDKNYSEQLEVPDNNDVDKSNAVAVNSGVQNEMLNLNDERNNEYDNREYFGKFWAHSGQQSEENSDVDLDDKIGKSIDGCDELFNEMSISNANNAKSDECTGGGESTSQESERPNCCKAGDDCKGCVCKCKCDCLCQCTCDVNSPCKCYAFLPCKWTHDCPCHWFQF